LVTKHADVKEVLRSPKFSADQGHENYPFIYPAHETMLRAEERTILNMDGSEHNHHRRMVQAMFTPMRMAELRPRVVDTVSEMLERIAEGPNIFDFHEEIALAVPSKAIAELLGVPYEDHELFQKAAVARTDVNAAPQDVLDAGNIIGDYLVELILRKMKATAPGDDLLGRLIDEQIRPGNISIDDAVVMARLILQAGHDSTASTISMGTLVLLQHPDQVKRLRSDENLIPGAVEEVLRFTGTAQFSSRRVALEDVSVGGQIIKQGEGVLALVTSANRDASVFEDPDSFDIERDARQHLAFSDGIHQCLGQHLARMELDVVYSLLFRRFPELRLAVALPELEFRDDKRAYGVYALPLARK
jgi:cytochrome P450